MINELTGPFPSTPLYHVPNTFHVKNRKQACLA